MQSFQATQSNLLETSVNYEQPSEPLWQANRTIKDIVGLLDVIDLSIHELNDPITISLGLSELLLSQVEADDPLLKDLTTLNEQVKRMREVIRTINRLTDYETKDRTICMRLKG